MPEFPDDIALGSNPPEILNEIGRREWRRIWKQLNKLRFIKDVDRNNLMLYCIAYQDFIFYEKICRLEGGAIFETRTGYQSKTPAVVLKREAMETMFKISKEFGMTTMARMRMGELSEAEEDEFEKFVRNG